MLKLHRCKHELDRSRADRRNNSSFTCFTNYYDDFQNYGHIKIVLLFWKENWNCDSKLKVDTMVIFCFAKYLLSCHCLQRGCHLGVRMSGFWSVVSKLWINLSGYSSWWCHQHAILIQICGEPLRMFLANFHKVHLCFIIPPVSKEVDWISRSTPIQIGYPALCPYRLDIQVYAQTDWISRPMPMVFICMYICYISDQLWSGACNLN